MHQSIPLDGSLGNRWHPHTALRRADRGHSHPCNQQWGRTRRDPDLHFYRSSSGRPARIATPDGHCCTRTDPVMTTMWNSCNTCRFRSLVPALRRRQGSRCTRPSPNKHEDPEVPVLQLDYQFFSRDGQLVEHESKHATVLTCTDLSSGWPVMAYVPQKGAEVYTVRSVVAWVQRSGYPKMIIQHDQQPALRTLMKQVEKEFGHDHVQIRAAPRYSHASQKWRGERQPPDGWDVAYVVVRFPGSVP